MWAWYWDKLAAVKRKTSGLESVHPASKPGSPTYYWWFCHKSSLCLGAESQLLILSFFITFFPIWERTSWIEPVGELRCYTTNGPLASLQEVALLTQLLRTLWRYSDHPRYRDLWRIAGCQLSHGVRLSKLKGNEGNIALAHQTPSTICLTSKNLSLCLHFSNRPMSSPATMLSWATVVLISPAEFEEVHPHFELL